ncbi:MAG: DNA-directed RNA polymerase subunit beta [bacterium]|nr:DNA-directed RNA polymerase subunit beta [bacterium]
MAEFKKFGLRKRLTFSKIPEVLDVPNLMEIQKNSYEEFLQMDIPLEKRKMQGLHEAFCKVFPITDFKGNATLEFVSYNFGKPKYSVLKCQERDMSYTAPLRIKTRLIIREDDKTSGEKKVKSIKEQEVFMGELPLMTDRGTFVINGAERVIVSQLHRSPGVAFSTEEKAGRHTLGRRLYMSEIIPYQGAWMSFEVDAREIIYARIDRKRKFPATLLLRALGYGSSEDILGLFFDVIKVDLRKKTKKEVVDLVLGQDVVDVSTGEIIAQVNQAITSDLFDSLKKADIKEIKVLDGKLSEYSPVRTTLLKDTVYTTKEALIEIYKKQRPGDPPSVESAQALLDRLFFNQRRYDLSRVGRYMLNRRLGLDVSIDIRTLRKEDVVGTIKALLMLKHEGEVLEDIDHLGNRRVRSAGELLQNQIRIGLARMERTVKERMSISDMEVVMPSHLINAKPLTAAAREFFGSSQLSQFMDQTNPLSELTHKRRLSALGPGGLSRERAGFEVRDVHYTHYGRVCPIETPEGPNIGLIVSLSTYARVNEYGFIETPYRKVTKGVVGDSIDYLSADVEDKYIIAQANVVVDSKGKFLSDRISARHKGDFPMIVPPEIHYMDVSPKQLVSIATSLIPFLEHDDANRALMGSNMQRQAVPLLRAESPIIGTGMEYRVARDSGGVIIAEHSGIVESVSANEIAVSYMDEDKKKLQKDVYALMKFKRSNQDTCINQKPLVSVGDKVKAGYIIADGPATELGELALGQNILVAFMPWCGYNFEDAIVINENIVKKDFFTSIHIERFELEARDTKLGKEEITRDIPNVSEEAIKNLDDRGIIRIGADVKPGDILVGKISPKGEVELTPEEKLLRAIFGEKAGDARDASLRASPGVEGKAIDVKVFSRSEKDKDEKTKEEEKQKSKEIEKEYLKKCNSIEKKMSEDIVKIIEGLASSNNVVNEENKKIIIKSGNTLTAARLEKLKSSQIKSIKVTDKEIMAKIQSIKLEAQTKISEIEQEKEIQLEKIKKGDELPPGVIKLVKVYIAKKRKLSVGDKIAGRHGNKGVVARIVAEEDMPYLEDGTPVDIILNPLGVPSRMNVGQILETHLGWAAHKLGCHIASPVFDGAKEIEIKDLLKKAGLPESGKTKLYDGRTGEVFAQDITVGYIYILKLAHLVDDKIHARSIGPYSLVTQQPLGGKAQFGGQRFGEMEVWALEAYGAAYTLQELLTVKSDDVVGRTRIYESIVKGNNILEAGMPESFNVLEKELRSLGLNITREIGDENAEKNLEAGSTQGREDKKTEKKDKKKKKKDKK